MRYLSTVREITVRCLRGVSFQLAGESGLASWKLTPLVSRTVLRRLPGFLECGTLSPLWTAACGVVEIGFRDRARHGNSKWRSVRRHRSKAATRRRTLEVRRKTRNADRASMRRPMIAMMTFACVSMMTGAEDPASAGRLPDLPVRKIPVAQRAAGDPARGPFHADRGSQRLVPRGLEERAAGPHGLRPSVRAHDVPRFAAPRQRLLRSPAASRRPAQRLDQPGPHQLLGNRAVELPGAGLVDGIRPHGLPAAGHDAGQAGQSAGRGAERAAAELREPALRSGERGAAGGPVPARASVQLADDRLDGRPGGGLARGRGGLLPPLLPSGQCQPVHRRRL